MIPPFTMMTIAAELAHGNPSAYAPTEIVNGMVTKNDGQEAARA